MRTAAREAVYKIVFSQLFQENAAKGFRSAVYRAEKLDEDDRAYAEKLLALIGEHREELNALLNANVTRFADYRVYPADRAALLVALAEIRYFDDIPVAVSVSEAVALARKYSTEKSADFVNGVLGGIVNK